MDVKSRNNFASRKGELKPRELMERAASPAMIPDEALLAILLKTGVQGLNVVELSRRLLEAFGSLKNLVSADWRGLEERIRSYNKTNSEKRILGVGHIKCLELAAAFEMGRRWARISPEEIRKIKVDCAQEAYRVFKAVHNPADEKENVFVLLLDAKCHPLCEPIVSIRGESTSATLSPKEIFKEAIRWGATAVIVAHNHPSGTVEPSEDDFELTRKLVAVADVVSMPLVDHLILGVSVDGQKNEFLSIRELKPSLFGDG